MATLTQPLRDEHKELLPHVTTLLLAGDAIQEVLTPADRVLMDESYTFLTYHLLPHAQAEEKALYPVVQKVMGSADGTATMSRDHLEIQQLTEELGVLRANLTGTRLSTEQANALRRVLYGIYAIVKLHFAKEEEVYLPLLDAHLRPEEAEAMFAAMEKAASEVKAQLPANL